MDTYMAYGVGLYLDMEGMIILYVWSTFYWKDKINVLTDLSTEAVGYRTYS